MESLKAEQARVQQQLIDLDNELEAMEQQHQLDLEAINERHLKEIEIISSKWTGTALNKELKPVKADHKSEIKACQDKYKEKVKETKEQHKTRKKILNNTLKRLEKEIFSASGMETSYKPGKLELVSD